MPSIEPRTGVEEGSSSQLEDILTTIPLLKSHANKPNVSIVHPIPRAVVVVKDNPPPVAAAAPRDAFLANLEAQIQRPALENHSGLADSRKYPTSVIPKRRQVPMDPMLQKPLFITTVPSGVFLEPLTADQAPRKIYHFSSHPRVCSHNYNLETQSFMAKLSSKKQNFFGSGSIEQPFNKSQKGMRNEAQQQQQSYQNLMFDKRVVRGSNFTPNNLATNAAWNPNFAYAGLLSGRGGAGGEATDVTDGGRRRQLLRKKQQRTRNGDPNDLKSSPPPVRGRRNERVQTEKYLEELAINPYEIDVACQTDLYLERPSTPPFADAAATPKTGIDVAVQVDDNFTSDNFDLDRELKAVIDDCIAQAVVEVAQDRVDQEQHSSEQSPGQEGGEEREQRKEKRPSAANILQGYVADLLPSILNSIKSIRDAENNEELKRQLAPWLAQEVAQEVGQIIDSRELLKDLVKEILQERAELYVAMSGDHRGATKQINLFEDDTFDSQGGKRGDVGGPQFPEKIEHVLSRNVETLERLEREKQSSNIRPFALASKSSTSDQVTSLESDEIVSGRCEGEEKEEETPVVEQSDEKLLEDLETEIIESAEGVASEIEEKNDTVSSVAEESVEQNFNIEITPKSPVIEAEEKIEDGKGQEVQSEEKEENNSLDEEEKSGRKEDKGEIEEERGISDDDLIDENDDKERDDKPQSSLENSKRDPEEPEVKSVDVAETENKMDNVQPEDTSNDNDDLDVIVIKGSLEGPIEESNSDANEVDKLEEEEELKQSSNEKVAVHEEFQTEKINELTTTPDKDVQALVEDTKDVAIANNTEDDIIQNIVEEMITKKDMQEVGSNKETKVENEIESEKEIIGELPASPVDNPDKVIVVAIPEKEDLIEKESEPDHQEVSERKTVPSRDSIILIQEQPSEFKMQFEESPVIQTTNLEKDPVQNDLQEDFPEIVISPSVTENPAVVEVPQAAIEDARLETPNLDSISYPDDDLLDMISFERGNSSPGQRSNETGQGVVDLQDKGTFKIIEGAEVLLFDSAQQSIAETEASKGDDGENTDVEDDPQEVTEVKCSKRIISTLTTPELELNPQRESSAEDTPLTTTSTPPPVTDEESSEKLQIIEEPQLKPETPINNEVGVVVTPPHNETRDVKTPTAPPADQVQEDVLIKKELDNATKTPPNQLDSPFKSPEINPETMTQPIPCEDMDLYSPQTDQTVDQEKQVSFEDNFVVDVVESESPEIQLFKVDEQDNESLLNAFCSDLNNQQLSPKSSSGKSVKMISFDDEERAAVATFVDDIEQTAKFIVQSPLPLEKSSFLFDIQENKLEDKQTDSSQLKDEEKSVTTEIREEVEEFVHGIQKEAHLLSTKLLTTMEAVTDLLITNQKDVVEIPSLNEEPQDNQLKSSTSNQGRDEMDSSTLAPPPAVNYDSDMEMDSLEVGSGGGQDAIDNDSIEVPTSFASEVENVRDDIEEAVVTIIDLANQITSGGVNINKKGEDETTEIKSTDVEESPKNVPQEAGATQDDKICDDGQDVLIIKTKDGKL